MGRIESFFGRYEFVNWLIHEEYHTEGTARSYASYISKLHQLYSFGDIENMVYDGNTSMVEFEFDTAITKINHDINKYPNDEIGKIKSALHKYYEYILIITLNNANENSYYSNHDSKNRRRIGPIVFFHEDLLKKFKSRINTQDRFSGEIFFPINIVKKILYHNGEKTFYDNWVNNLVYGIIFNVYKRAIPFEYVDALEIFDDGITEIWDTNRERHTLYTKSALSNSFYPLSAFSTSDIVIDHIVPMKIILEEFKEYLPALKYITKEIKACNNNKRINGRKNLNEIGNILTSNKLIDYRCVPDLINELDLISKHTKLEIMSSKENLIKSGN